MKDWGSLHDTVLGATGDDLSEIRLKQLFTMLPSGIRSSAHMHGLGDTEVRDDIYKHLKEKGVYSNKAADFQVNGKEIEDEKPCELKLRFSSMTDMVLLMQMMNDCNDEDMRLITGDGERQFSVVKA